MSFAELPHRRFNPLTGEWLLVSPHRAKRPWQGQQAKTVRVEKNAYEASCYLCPGNERVGGEVNSDYAATFVFTNDHQAVLPDSPEIQENADGLFQAQSVKGTARVICFSPRHDLTLADMSVVEIGQVITTWMAQYQELGETYQWVQVFENKGEMMGCSSPHPHGQIWATAHLPNEAVKEDSNQRAYFEKHGKPMLLDYVEKELAQQARVLYANDDWVVLVPYWATWPFETMVLPRFAVPYMTQLSAIQQASLAEALKVLLVAYDQLFDCSFPYSMGWHGAPFNGVDNAHWQLHAHFYPPLLRSSTVRKFMVGYEMMAETQRDLTPEQAAARIRDNIKRS